MPPPNHRMAHEPLANLFVANLFVVGAMRSGTTSLHETLGRHPDIAMSAFKEPAFFTDPDELGTDSRISLDAGYVGDPEAYAGLFDGAGDARYRGESSTHYTKAPRINGAAHRIAAAVPDAHIIYLVRDPVLRTLSHYRYALRRKTERRPCLEAVRAEPFYTQVSNYAMQLAPFFDAFEASQIRVVVLEELIADPASTLTELYGWLGLSPHPEALTMDTANALAPVVQQARGPEALHRIGGSSVYQRIARAVLPVALRQRVRSLLNQPVETQDVVTDEVLTYLRSVHAPQVAALEALVGRSFATWSLGENG